MWNRTEENILKEFYGRYPMDRLQEMLPNRSAGAIQTRAKALGLNDPARRLLQNQNDLLRDKSIAELEAELKVRKLQVEIESVEKQLAVFEDNAIRNRKSFQEVKGDRGKLTSRISQLRMNLFKTRLENAGL
jgi:hypothetical protein